MVVLGLDTSATARKLVRLLLADPLGDAQLWEQQLEGATPDGGESLLIRWVFVLRTMIGANAA